MSEAATREEFASEMAYEEIRRKCFCCGRMIPVNALEAEMLGAVRSFCGQECVEVFRTYRLPYVDAR